MLKEKDKEELQRLVHIAKEQGNCINLNLVYMIMKDSMDYETVMKYFEDQGISLIQDDIEPDITAYSCEGEKIRPFDPSKINITMKPLTLDALLKRIKNQEIEFDSSFQRKAGLWNKSQEFVVEKTLKLKDMEFFPELNGCGYDKLPRTFQRRIDETVINIYLVNHSTPENVKFNIFKRINTGGLALEPQEIRNALFQGKATQFLQECSQMECFITATSGSVKSERMLDREFVLRYVSFCYLDLEGYTGNIDEFLNEGMKFLNHADLERLEEIKKEFAFTMESIYSIMERNAFRKICDDGRRRPINKVIFESWCYVIRALSIEQVKILKEKKEEIQVGYMHLCSSADYLYLLKLPDKKAVYGRIKAVQELINEFL